LREAWQDPIIWEAALVECRARYPLQAVAIDGVSWSFLDTGVGDATLLLLPGAMGFADTSFHFVLAFAPAMRVLSVSYPASHTDGDRLVDELAELLTARGIGAAHVVGGSYSGLVAQQLADRYPQHVASLILANTWAADPARARYFRPAAWLVARLPAWLLQRLMSDYMSRFLPGADPATRFWRSYFQAILPAFTPVLIASRLHAFTSLDTTHWPSASVWLGPALLVESTDDRLFGARSRRALRRRYSQADLVELDCPGHAAALTHVGDYVRLYRHWLASVRGTTDRDIGSAD
jgi:pimeloyl-ACP methyl ester carboxylesterase